MTQYRAQRTHARIAASILAVVLVVGAVAPLRVARAYLPVEDFMLNTWELYKWQDDQVKQAKETIETGLLDSFSFQLQLALIDAFNFIGNRFAYETAVWLASGGQGQSPLFDGRSQGAFVKDTFLGAGLEFVDALDRFTARAVGQTEIGQELLSVPGAFGIANFICKPALPEVTLAIKLGLQNRLKPVQPRCTAQQLGDNWEQFVDSTTGNPAEALRGIGATFESGQTDLAVALDLNTGLTEFSGAKLAGEEKQRAIDEGFRGDRTGIGLIDDYTRTPAQIVQEQVKDYAIRGPADVRQQNMQSLVESITSWDYFGEFAVNAAAAMAKNFALTLAAQAFQKQILEKGLLADLNLGALFGPTEFAFGENAAPTANRAVVARQVYAELQRPHYSAPGNLDLLSQFASCPNTTMRQPDTCVLDETLAKAIRERRTVQEMRAEIGGREFVAAGTFEDQDPNCYRNQLCASNLARLRLARVLPVGWELAAAVAATTLTTQETLDDVVGNFYAFGRDGKCGTLDDTSPFCGLIDPNWVFQYPEHICRLTAPTTTLLDRGASLRAEACVDAPSCVKPKADGTGCEEYGYCVRERRTWQLGGASCPDYAASCRALTSRTGADIAVLTNTVDYGTCNAGNVGCTRYSAAWSSGAATWSAVPSADRRYFNRSVEQCEEKNEGCTELVPTATAHANLIPNPSFERDENRDGVPDGWVLGTDPVLPEYPGRTATAFNGNAAVRVGYGVEGNEDSESAWLAQNVPVLGGKTYTMTAHALRTTAAQGRARLRLRIYNAAGDEVDLAGIAASSGCNVGDGTHLNGIGVYPHGSGAYTAGEVYRAASCTFTLPGSATSAELKLYGERGQTVWFDAVQLEEGSRFTGFHEGYADGAPRTYLKVAPDDFNCSDGDPNNDHPSCTAFASVCRAEDAGCARYTPVGGGTNIPGTVSDVDRCPAACVGYAAYREVTSDFDERDAFDYFIPTPGRVQQCALADAGCAAFTNLDRSAAGGEQRESYSFLRQCVKPSDAEVVAATYYTWEGSEAEGYAIRRFTLQASTSDRNSAPLTFGSGTADCGPSGTGNYGKRAGGPGYDADPGYDAEVTPDCRAFYSENGTIAYRRLSRTIVVDDACTNYRPEHVLTQVVCDEKGGTWEADECRFKGLPSASTQCSAVAVGCRAYRGSESGVVANRLTSDFEATSGDVFGGWERADGNSWASGDWAGESVRTAGHSMRLGANIRAGHAAALVAGGTYEVLLVAKGGGEFTVDLVGETGSSLVLHSAGGAEHVTLGSTWRQVTLGPFILGSAETEGARLTLMNAETAALAYVDEVTLREVPQQIAVIKNSWTVPAACDMSAVGAGATPQAQGMLGCRAYTTTDQGGTTRTETLRSFTRLCSEKVIGCTAYANTQNSTALGEQQFQGGASASDGVTVPADAPIYLVDQPQSRCEAAARGCTRFGIPTLDRTGTGSGGALGSVTGWTDVFLRDDPERYVGPGGTLCEEEALFCEEYRGSDGTLTYFKKPGDRTCAWREGVEVGGVLRDGWFVAGEDTPCPGSRLSGGTYAMLKNSDTGYDTWVGTCTAAQDQCIELRDPTDTSYAYPTGRPYTAIRTSLDLASCAGKASRKEGCVLLEETGNPAITWSAAATYAKSETLRDAGQDPLNCETSIASCKRCVQGKHCVLPDGTPGSVASCTTDDNCRPPSAGAGSTDAFARCVVGSRVGGTCTSSTSCDSGYTCESFTNDANLLVKVEPGRQCSQWYARAGESEAFDERTGRTVQIATSVKLTGEGGGVLRRPAPSYLTIDAYQARDLSWGGEEYVGYAIPNRAGLEFYEQLDIEGEKRLVPVYCPANFPASGTSTKGCGPTEGSCPAGAIDGAPCGPDVDPSSGELYGKCYDGRCAHPPVVSAGAGGTVLPGIEPVDAEPQACKAYPEKDAPFPRDVAHGVLRQDWDRTSGTTPSFNRNFESVRLCDDADGTACECQYQKATYGTSGQPKYYARESAMPLAICIGGTHDGLECSADAVGVRAGTVLSCIVSEEDSEVNNGRCTPLKRNDPVLGVPGFCLERDMSRPVYGQSGDFACRTFFPVDQLENAPDINYQVQTAGFQPNEDQYMCLVARGNAYRPQWRRAGAPAPITSTYPTNTDYWVALRLESEYAAVDLEQRILFSNVRTKRVQGDAVGDGYDEGDTSGLEQFGFVGVPQHEVTLRQGESIVDRVYKDSIRTRRSGNFYWPLVETDEWSTFWSSRAVLRSYDENLDFDPFISSFPLNVLGKEVRAIHFQPATWLDSNSPLGAGVVPSFKLDAGNDWTMCVKKSQTAGAALQFFPGLGPTNSEANPCWGDAQSTDDFELFGDRRKHLFSLGACEDSDSIYYGVRVSFGASGENARVFSGYCHDQSTDQSSQPYDIYVEFAEYCTDVVQVYQSAGRVGKPWSNRLWPDRVYAISDVQYKHETPVKPFGGSSVNSSPQSLLYVDEAVIGGAPQRDGSNVAGAPYGCDGTCTKHSNYPGQSTLETISTPDGAAGKVVEVFASVLRWWHWDGDSYEPKEDPASSQELASWDVSSQATPRTGSDETARVPSAPIVRAVLGGDVTGGTPTYTEGDAGRFTVGGEDRGVVPGEGGSMEAKIQFYLEANPNQLPVRFVRVDPGDGTSGYTAGRSSYPNHRSACKSDADAANFGETSAACVNRPFTFTARYDCPSGSDVDLPTCIGGADPEGIWRAGGTDASGNVLPNWYDRGCWDPSASACVYRPRIRVQDNWSYCTNDPGNPDIAGDEAECGAPGSPGGTLCFDSDDGRRNECRDEEQRSFVPFDGRIVLTPP